MNTLATDRIDAAPNMRLAKVQTIGILGDRRDVVRTYDDGFGPVFCYRDAGGLLAVVRARTWEDAWSICEDVIFDDADTGDLDGLTVGDDLPEGCGYRPNGGDPQLAWAQTGVYREDLNGSALDLLTGPLMEQLGIALTWEHWDETD
jgi:hypothetical protein